MQLCAGPVLGQQRGRRWASDSLNTTQKPSVYTCDVMSVHPVSCSPGLSCYSVWTCPLACSSPSASELPWCTAAFLSFPCNDNKGWIVSLLALPSLSDVQNFLPATNSRCHLPLLSMIPPVLHPLTPPTRHSSFIPSCLMRRDSQLFFGFCQASTQDCLIWQAAPWASCKHVIS